MVISEQIAVAENPELDWIVSSSLCARSKLLDLGLQKDCFSISIIESQVSAGGNPFDLERLN